ncbi:hypothetical protein BC830DRAFT_1142974 [Chytriomyces sp. MP71]|nr:hypothetical protein BC830DRAFT_1142974 [Chytriomyces sp. MP71]
MRYCPPSRSYIFFSPGYSPLSSAVVAFVSFLPGTSPTSPEYSCVSGLFSWFAWLLTETSCLLSYYPKLLSSLSGKLSPFSFLFRHPLTGTISYQARQLTASEIPIILLFICVMSQLADSILDNQSCYREELELANKPEVVLAC